MKRLDLPQDYKPFSKLIICGNTLINVQIPFEIDGEIPLLIGDNGIPKIWLSALASTPQKKWYQIISANRSLHKDVKISILDNEKVIVIVGSKKVLEVRKRSHDIPKITNLDLRPIGLNIFGDTSKLMIGKNELANNTFQNVSVMVGLGENK